MTFVPALKKSALLISVFVLCMVIVFAGAWNIKKHIAPSIPAHPSPAHTDTLPVQPRKTKSIFLTKTTKPHTYTLHVDSEGEALSAISIRFKADAKSTQKMDVSLREQFSKNGWQTILNTRQALTGDTHTAAFEVAFLTLEPLGGSVFTQQDTLAEIKLDATTIVLDEDASTATTREGKEFGLQLHVQ